MTKVLFEGGESCRGSEACNFMMDTDALGLYAEVVASDWDECPEYDPNDPDSFDMLGFDDYSYPILKSEIIRQAVEAGIDVGSLHFHWDDRG